MNATPKPREYYYSVSVSSEPVSGLPRLTEVSIFAKHGKYELLAKTDSAAKAALIVQAVNTHERAKELAQAVIKTYGCEVTAPLYEKAKALLADMEG